MTSTRLSIDKVYYQLIQNINTFKAIQNEWDIAIEKSCQDNPFVLSDIVINWWETYGSNKELYIFVLYESNKIIGGFPLYVYRKYFIKLLTQIGDGHANITEPFFIKEYKDIFFNKLRKAINQKGWDIFYLDRVENLFIDNNIKKEYIIDIKSTDYNQIIKLENNDIDQYIKSRGKNLKNNIRKAYNKAKKHGELQFIKVSQEKEILELLDYHFYFSVESRKQRGDKSSFINKDEKEFVIKSVLSMANKGMIDAHKLMINNKIVGVSIGYRFGGNNFKWIYTSYSPYYSNVSLGQIIIYELIKFIITNNDAFFNMYAGSNVFYKQKWCNYKQKLYKIKIFKKNIFGGFLSFFYSRYYNIKHK